MSTLEIGFAADPAPDEIRLNRLDSGIAAIAEHIRDLRRSRGDWTPQEELEELVWSALGGDAAAMHALVVALR